MANAVIAVQIIRQQPIPGQSKYAKQLDAN
jgi:hypothetical protein